MKEISRLLPSQDVQELVKKYIFSGLTDEEVLAILIKNKEGLTIPKLDAGLLKNEAVLLQTIKVLTLLELSDTKEEFEELADKLKYRQNSHRTPVEFDKIMQKLLNTPPPK